MGRYSMGPDDNVKCNIIYLMKENLNATSTAIVLRALIILHKAGMSQMIIPITSYVSVHKPQSGLRLVPI